MATRRLPPWHLARSCGLLLVPALAWNLAFAGRLPPAYQAELFWHDIPASLTWVEQLTRVAVFALPFALPLEPGASAAHRRGLRVFLLGLLLYLASWCALMAAPDSAWSRSALGFTAPAWTPALWLLGLAMLGRRAFWGRGYRWWMALPASATFVLAHTSHAAMVFSRLH